LNHTGVINKRSSKPAAKTSPPFAGHQAQTYPLLSHGLKSHPENHSLLPFRSEIKCTSG
jgi:hypothetical protein